MIINPVKVLLLSNKSGFILVIHVSYFDTPRVKSGIQFEKYSCEEKIMEERNPIQHVLMADDDKDHAMLFECIIRKDYPSVTISYVQDGEQLMQFLHLHPVDILFLDLHMPCKNGYECLQEIRKEAGIKDLPVVVYSSSAHLSDIQKSFLHEADFYLVKPFKTSHLKRAIQMILSVNWKDNPPIKRHYFINNSFVPFTAIA